MVSSGINSQGQGADPHGGNLIEEKLLAILEKKKKRTHLPGADCTRTPRQGVQEFGMEQSMLPGSGWEAWAITKLEGTASSSLTSSLVAHCLHH